MREFYIVDYGEKKIYDLGSMTMARKNIAYLASVINWHNEMQINTDYKSEFYSDLRWNFNTNSNSKWYIDRIK